MFDIEEELKKLPEQPGVYIMHDKHDEIIYIGKAIILKNRVRQYFQSNKNMTSKIMEMVSKIVRFEYIVTDSELEALILECNLIKEHQPKYNTKLKTGQGYPYIRITVNEEFPRIIMAREMKKDKSKYYGPYTNSEAVRSTIELIRITYCIRSCNKVLPKEINKSRPCLYYHIKQCNAPCQGYITSEEYRKSLVNITDFLNGNYTNIKVMLEDKMQKASEALEFERAAQYRDLLSNVMKVSQKQKLSNQEVEDKDIIAFAKDGEVAVVQVFFIRSGKMMGRDYFRITGVDRESSSGVITNFVKQFYSGTPMIPKELVLQEEIEDKEVITEWLSNKRGNKVYIKVPKIGDKERLIELAEKNAMLVLKQDGEKLRREELRTTGAVKEITELLNIEQVNRIESFDISNTNGFESVGSMVVYENGKPKKSDYRKFKIKWVKGADDYKCLEEVLTRRFLHGQKEEKELISKNLDKEYGSFTRFPELIMMDGGKGQVNIALEVLRKLNLNIKVCGMVKDDNHRTRGIYYNNEEFNMDKSSEGFKLITRIQDETHRFAIEYHRSLHSKKQFSSVLDTIEGIGKVRRIELIKHFKSLENIKSASVDDLTSVKGMNKAVAQNVYNFFNN